MLVTDINGISAQSQKRSVKQLICLQMFTVSVLLVAIDVIVVNCRIEIVRSSVILLLPLLTNNTIRLQRAGLTRYRTVSHASGLVPGTLWRCLHYGTRFMEQHHRHRIEVVRDDWNKQ